MCAAGGGDSKLNRLRLPLNPYEVVWGCNKSSIVDYLPFSPVKYTIMIYPIFSVPKFVVGGDRLNGNKALVCQNKLAFCNAS